MAPQRNLCVAVALALVAMFSTIGIAANGDARPAPPIALPDRDGAVTTLESLRGHVVLVDIWASWCPPCRAAFPAYDLLYREYRGKGFNVLAVNVDEKRSAADEFLKGRDFQMRVLFDPKGTAPAGFKLRGMPTSYLVDKHGAIRFSHEGFTEKLVLQYRREIEQLLAETP
ncbi:MAG: TlpA family protein disulfide reductase [Vicinamibacterales bacterium]|nr:TlpA family protein disulfide reductase [Vicinamibacterales bacterium]